MGFSRTLWLGTSGGRKTFKDLRSYRDSGQKWNREVPKKTPLRVRDLGVCLGPAGTRGSSVAAPPPGKGAWGRKGWKDSGRLGRGSRAWEGGRTCLGGRWSRCGSAWTSRLSDSGSSRGEAAGSPGPWAVGRGPGVAGVDVWEGCRQWQLGVRTEQVTGQAEVSTQLSLSCEVEGAGGKPCGTGTSRGHLRAGAEMWDESLSRDGDKLTKTIESTSVQSHGY